MSKPGLHLINVSSLSFIKKKIFFSNFKFFKYSYTTGYGVFYWLLTQWGSFFTLCLLIQWEYNLWIFIIKIFWEHVDWNYPQFHTEFIGIKILSPLSSISFLLPIFPVNFHIFPSILFFTSLKIVDLSIANIFANLYCFSTELYKSI